jgi:hypothetical protein
MKQQRRHGDIAVWQKIKALSVKNKFKKPFFISLFRSFFLSLVLFFLSFFSSFFFLLSVYPSRGQMVEFQKIEPEDQNSSFSED